MKNNYHVAFIVKGSITESFTVACLPTQIERIVKDHRKDHPEIKGQRVIITKK